MKVNRIFNAQPAKIPHFKSLLTCKQARWPHFLLHFLMFISWMLITPSFKKSLIVEQFQGNYLKLQLCYSYVPANVYSIECVHYLTSLAVMELSWNKRVFTWENRLVWNTKCGCRGVMWKRSILACELSCRKYAISELTCASVSRRVLVQNISYEN